MNDQFERDSERDVDDVEYGRVTTHNYVVYHCVALGLLSIKI